MGVDNWLTKSLNHWGEHQTALIKILANDLVYLVIAMVLVWLVLRSYKLHQPIQNFKSLITDLVLKGIFVLAIPVGAATVISELISQVYVRHRPFVGLPGIKLLVTHGADGGMPSHHMVFMATAVAMVYFYDKFFGLFLFVLTIVSGLARVSAGIHYPSDVVAGIVLGWLVSRLYQFLMRKQDLGLLRL
jgi:membrane-associated phospholipid phosphatase